MTTFLVILTLGLMFGFMKLFQAAAKIFLVLAALAILIIIFIGLSL
jgi:hypothetical protein